MDSYATAPLAENAFGFRHHGCAQTVRKSNRPSSKRSRSSTAGAHFTTRLSRSVRSSGDRLLATALVRWPEQPPTGKSFEVDVCTVARWENGEIVEENLFYDVVGMMRQLGLG